MFESLRGEFGFSYYGERRTSASVDIPLAVVVYVVILISIATIVAAIGIRGKARWYTLIRVVYSLSVGSTILLCLFGDCWVEGIDRKVSVPYIYRSDAEISGTVGLNIGLQKINITLKGYFENSRSSVKYNEAIDFNGAISSITDFRHYLERGLPQPVLTVVEFFSVDVGGFRWGRSYALAGYIAKILLLTSFSLWILANVMICSVVFYGGALFTLTGVTMFSSSIVYHCLLPSTKLKFFCSESEFHLFYGICFWSIMLMGILATIVGLVILVMDSKMPKTIQKFFLVEDNDEIDDGYEAQQKNSLALNTPLYKKNDFRRQSAPSLAQSHHSQSSTDINKVGTLYSVAEVDSQAGSPPMRRSATNPHSLKSAYSLESLRAFSERNEFREMSKIEKHYKSNPLFDQSKIEKTNASELFSKRGIGRLQTAISLESLPSVPDSKAPSSDSGLDNDDRFQYHSPVNTVSRFDTSASEQIDNNSDKIDVSMFEMREAVRKHETQGAEQENSKVSNIDQNKVFSINMDNTDSLEEERLREIYIDLSSANP